MPEHLWVYGVVGGEAPVPAQLGVDPNSRVELVRAAGLAALTSSTRERWALRDAARFETLARSHARVLEAALARGPVVPFRVGTVLTDEAGVRELLTQARSTFVTALRRLRGCAEWGVKVSVPQLAAVASVATVPASPRDRLALAHTAGADPSRDAGDAFLRRVHGRLAGHAGDVLINPPAEGPPLASEADVALDARYLVADDQARAFAAEAAQLARDARDHGMALELSGPWPAYHFSALAA
jgi:hypothetical protein